jgi:hypothetical protein
VAIEERNRLLADADDKYFLAGTSVAVWIGVKIELSQPKGNERFWIGVGRRRLLGFEMYWIHQSDDGNGVPLYLPVDVPAGVELAGEMRVPGSLIFDGVVRNQESPAPADLIITHEEIWKAIQRGLRRM